MDVTCVCGEPWDQHHLRHDEVWETDLGEREARAFSEGHLTLRAPGVREAFERLGWKFAGDSVLAVLRCPACPKPEECAGGGDEPGSPGILAARVRERAEARAVLAELLGGDEDGLACELEDLAAGEDRA